MNRDWFKRRKNKKKLSSGAIKSPNENIIQASTVFSTSPYNSSDTSSNSSISGSYSYSDSLS